jgi:hypothetical protein
MGRAKCGSICRLRRSCTLRETRQRVVSRSLPTMTRSAGQYGPSRLLGRYL